MAGKGPGQPDRPPLMLSFTGSFGEKPEHQGLIPLAPRSRLVLHPGLGSGLLQGVMQGLKEILCHGNENERWCRGDGACWGPSTFQHTRLLQ